MAELQPLHGPQDGDAHNFEADQVLREVKSNVPCDERPSELAEHVVLHSKTFRSSSRRKAVPREADVLSETDTAGVKTPPDADSRPVQSGLGNLHNRATIGMACGGGPLRLGYRPQSCMLQLERLECDNLAGVDGEACTVPLALRRICVCLRTHMAEHMTFIEQGFFAANLCC